MKRVSLQFLTVSVAIATLLLGFGWTLLQRRHIAKNSQEIEVHLPLLASDQLPKNMTCANALPIMVNLSGLPKTTAWLAVTLVDESGKVFWQAWDIQYKQQKQIVPGNGVTGRNYAGDFGYRAPCAKDGKEEQVVATIFVFTEPLRLKANTNTYEVTRALRTQSIAQKQQQFHVK